MENLQNSIKHVAKSVSHAKEHYANVVAHKPYAHSIKCVQVTRKFTVGKELSNRVFKAHSHRSAITTKAKLSKSPKDNPKGELSRRFKKPLVLNVDSNKVKSDTTGQKVAKKQSNQSQSSGATKH